MATTTTYSLIKPTVGGDENTWGQDLNDNFDIIDAALTFTVPAGGIIMWSGSVASIPAGWLLCDGTSGTPNLQNRFIVGAGDTHAPGATGGSDSTTLAEANLPSHTHSFSATTGAAGSHSHSTTSDGNHTHRFTYGVRNIGGSTAGGFGPSFFGSPITAVDDGSITEVRTRDNMVQNVNSGHSHTISTAADHTHTVSGTTEATGSGTAIDNRPAFYALAYIMKA